MNGIILKKLPLHLVSLIFISTPSVLLAEKATLTRGRPATISSFGEFQPTIKFLDSLKDLKKHPLKNAVIMRISPEGLKKINKKLPSMLKGMNVDEGQWEAQNFDLGTYQISDLEEMVSQDLKPYFIVAKLFLINLIESPIHTISPQIKISDLNYSFEVSDIALNPLEQKADGSIAFGVRASIKNIKIKMNSGLILPTLKNSRAKEISWGSIGADEITTTIGLKNPLIIDSTLSIQFDRNEKILLSFDTMKTNLESTDLSMNIKNISWEKLTSTPKTTKRKLNKQELKEMEQNKRALNTAVQQFIKNNLMDAKIHIDKLIEESKFKEAFGNISTDISNQYTEFGMAIPELFMQDSNHKNQPQIVAGLKMQRMQMTKKQSLLVFLNGFIESTEQRKNYDLSGLKLVTSEEKGGALNELVNQSTSDLSLLIGSDFISRYFQINHKNGILENLNLRGYDIKFTLLENPKLEFMSAEDVTKEKLPNVKNRVYVKSTGLMDLDLSESKHWFLPDKQAIKGTVLLSLDYINKNRFSLNLHRIDAGDLMSEAEVQAVLKTSQTTPSSKDKRNSWWNQILNKLSPTGAIKSVVIPGINSTLSRIPVNLISTLALEKDGQESVQLFPDQLLGLPTLIQSIAPQGQDHLKIEFSLTH